MKIIQCTENHLDELIFVAKQSFIDAFEKQTEPSNFQAYMSKAFTKEGVLEELQHPQSAFFFLQTTKEKQLDTSNCVGTGRRSFSQQKKRLNCNAFICLNPIGIKVLKNVIRFHGILRPRKRFRLDLPHCLVSKSWCYQIL